MGYGIVFPMGNSWKIPPFPTGTNATKENKWPVGISRNGIHTRKIDVFGSRRIYRMADARSMRITRSPADKLFSEYIRTRDAWTCQRCFMQYPTKSQGLHCAHYWSRSMKSVRFDPENADALCYGCHAYFHKDPKAHDVFKLRQLGQQRMDALQVRARTPRKPDVGYIVLTLKSMLAQLKGTDAKES